NPKIALLTFIGVTSNHVTHHRSVSHYRNILFRFAHLIGNQPADRESVAAPYQNAGIERALVDNRALDDCAIKREIKIRYLVTDFGLYRQGDEIVFVD